jgi:hypothetical protein
MQRVERQRVCYPLCPCDVCAVFGASGPVVVGAVVVAAGVVGAVDAGADGGLRFPD